MSRGEEEQLSSICLLNMIVSQNDTNVSLRGKIISFGCAGGWGWCAVVCTALLNMIVGQNDTKVSNWQDYFLVRAHSAHTLRGVHARLAVLEQVAAVLGGRVEFKHPTPSEIVTARSAPIVCDGWCLSFTLRRSLGFTMHLCR
jgi:hypothetical protein